MGRGRGQGRGQVGRGRTGPARGRGQNSFPGISLPLLPGGLLGLGIPTSFSPSPGHCCGHGLHSSSEVHALSEDSQG